MTVSLNNLVKNLLLMAFVLYMAQGLIYLFQAQVFGGIILGSKAIKFIIFFLLLISFGLKLTYTPKIGNFSFLIICLYSIFLVYNFAVIQLSDSGGQSIQAFLYNYSLSIILLPLCLLYVDGGTAVGLDDKKTATWFAIIFFAISVLAIYEQLAQKSIFYGHREILSRNGLIKFDHINGVIRLNSIFKSPIDYSYINAIFASLFLYLFLKFKSYSYLCLVILMSIIELAILVRSGFVLMAVAYLSIVFLHFSVSQFIVYLFFGIPMLLLIVLYLYMNYSLIFDPTNLFVRLDQWGQLIKSIDSVSTLLFGKGVVQNGAFGQHHTIVIDNLYIGILYAGGVISLLIFFVIVVLLLIKQSSKLNAIDAWKIGAFLGMLAAGLFENVMHIFYVALIPLFFQLSNSPVQRKKVIYVSQDSLVKP